jgi:putative lipoprotein
MPLRIVALITLSRAMALRRASAGVALACVVLGLAACAPEPAGSPIRVSRPTTLAGTAWTLVAIGGRPLPAGPDVTLIIALVDLSGDGGCNSFGGSYTYDPASGAVAIGDLVSTKRACVEAVRNDIEAAYLRALRGASSASIDPDGRLILAGTGAELAFTVGPQPAGRPIAAPSAGP